MNPICKNILKLCSLSTLAALALLVSAPAQAGTGLDDETIYAIFDQANMADISTGRLGWKKAHAPEVKALAKMVVNDHSAVQQMGRELAQGLGYVGTPPDGDQSLADQAQTLAKLEALSGPAFDRAYLLHEIAFHQAVIDAVKGTLLPSIKNPQFQNLVSNVLPGFEAHLAATKDVARKLDIAP
ncbi:MAG: DUF4142 domain-containing protein [Rhodospirillales bacterium]|nr:DUF4142 domain-containing protein [Rhodospirillales bacterium]